MTAIPTEPHGRVAVDTFACASCHEQWTQRGIDGDYPPWGWLVCPHCLHSAPRPTSPTSQTTEEHA